MTFTTSRGALTRGTLAKRAGCHIETVRYYEKIGLLAPPARSPGGHRLYREADQRRLRFILRGRELGFPIEELRSLLVGEDVHGVTLGSVDGDPGVEIAQHIFVGSKAPWDHIGGTAPQFAEFSPALQGT